nr:LexA family transcriptional regulator [Deltaproteobacteria bacterium]
MATQVARRIAAARTACGVSQEVLAERLGMATRNLQRIEGGRQNLTLGTVERIAAALAVPPTSLLPPQPPRLLPSAASGEAPAVVPVIALDAAAGLIRDARSVSVNGWWLIDRAESDHPFVARVLGDSMEPLIPSGAYALFRAPAGPSSDGAVMLWQLRDSGAPEGGGSFLVKRFAGRHVGEDGLTRVTLASTNRSHGPLSIVVDSADRLQAIARFVRVVG